MDRHPWTRDRPRSEKQYAHARNSQAGCGERAHKPPSRLPGSRPTGNRRALDVDNYGRSTAAGFTSDRQPANRSPRSRCWSPPWMTPAVTPPGLPRRGTAPSAKSWTHRTHSSPLTWLRKTTPFLWPSTDKRTRRAPQSARPRCCAELERLPDADRHALMFGTTDCRGLRPDGMITGRIRSTTRQFRDDLRAANQPPGTIMS